MLSAAVERHVALMRACGFMFNEQTELLTDYAAFPPSPRHAATHMSGRRRF